MFRCPELGSQCVGRNLQRREPAGEHEQRRKDRPETVRIRADDHEEAARRHNAKRPEDHVDRSDAADHPGRRKRQQAVGKKEDDLGKERFGVIEAKGSAERND